MAEIARKTGSQRIVYPASDRNNWPIRSCMVEITTGVAETSGTVNMATEFGVAGTPVAGGPAAVLTWLAAPVGGTIQQDTGTFVANATVTTAGLVTTGTIVAQKNYWVIAYCI